MIPNGFVSCSFIRFSDSPTTQRRLRPYKDLPDASKVSSDSSISIRWVPRFNNPSSDGLNGNCHNIGGWRAPFANQIWGSSSHINGPRRQSIRHTKKKQMIWHSIWHIDKICHVLSSILAINLEFCAIYSDILSGLLSASLLRALASWWWGGDLNLETLTWQAGISIHIHVQRFLLKLNATYTVLLVCYNVGPPR